MLRLTGDALLFQRIRRSALAAAPGRSWDDSLAQLAAGYTRALDHDEVVTGVEGA